MGDGQPESGPILPPRGYLLESSEVSAEIFPAQSSAGVRNPNARGGRSILEKSDLDDSIRTELNSVVDEVEEEWREVN